MDQAQQTQLIKDLQAQIAAARPGSIANLAAAFVEAKKGIRNVVKNANNPHFGSNYADLSAVLDTFTEPFADNGLALVQAPGEIVDGNITLMGLLLHKSGESIMFKTQVPLGAKATAQAAGSAITYARRYQASAVAGIAQVDDDGNTASETTPAPRKPAKSKAPSEGGELIDRIEAAVNANDLAALEALKPEVAELGDRAVADAYVAGRKALKSGGAK